MNFTVIGLWNEMGTVARAVVVVLIAMSVYSLAIAVERLLAYRRGKARSLEYLKALAPLISQPGGVEAAGSSSASWEAPSHGWLGAGLVSS